MKLARVFIIFTLLLVSALGLYQTFATGVDTKQNQYSNELEGFTFFGNGKLKDLKLGLSKKKDVEMIFGKSCEKFCDYDENFKIKFEYLAALDDCMTTKDIRDRAMCPKNQFVGKISSITLEPKKERILKDLPTSKFNIVGGGNIGEKGSRVSVSYTSFTDNYGLRYSISSGDTIYSQYPTFVEGKLYSIQYIFTDEFIRNVFTVEYMTRKKELEQ